jgi:Family of unknown function (DUF6600)
MKRLFLAIAVLGLVLPALREVEARTDISIDFFYDSLGSDGNWVEVADYGYCWQPAVAVSNSSWRPYADGYWAYTDVGWTWVSYEDFGWATYHYGRWIKLRGRGWIWVPGREWGPAWVSWRTGGDYVGWAPLPPRGGGDVFYDNSPINSQVDVQFDIGPGYYNFIDIRDIGEPVLRERIFAADQNVTYITKTVNVTNITYTNSTVYNYGPDYNSLSRYSARPIQRLTLQRQADGDPLAAARSKSVMKVQGDKLVIAAPQQLQKPSKPIAPKVVKEKLAQAPLERGWEPAGDAKAQAELKQKMKAEDPKTVPPPSITPREDAAQSPGASSPVPAATMAPSVRASPAASAGPKTGTTPAKSPGPKRNPPPDDRDRMSPPITRPSAPGVDAPQPNVPPSRDKGAKKQKPPAMPSGAAPVIPTPPSNLPLDNRKQKNEPTPGPPNRDVQADSPAKHLMPSQPEIPSRRGPPKQQIERVAPPPSPGPNAPAQPEHSRKGPDKKNSEPSASPGQ